MDIVKLFDKTKLSFLLDKKAVFLSTIFFSLHHKWNKDIPTMCTDGVTLMINPDFFLSLSPEERVGVVAHECWHVAFSHMTRGMHLNHEVYNMAGDYVINGMLLSNNYTLPSMRLHDSRFDNMYTEQVYKILMDEGAGDKGMPDELKDIGYSDAGAEEVMANKIQNTVIKAATQAKMDSENNSYGNLPMDIVRMLDELLNPKVPWNVLLQQYMNEKCKMDFTFKKPNRRFFPEFHLPSMESNNTIKLSAAIDTSGSVTKEQLTAFMSEITHIKNSINPVSLDIVDFDTKIHNVFSFTREQILEGVEFSGGGGTDLQCVFDHYKDKELTVLIVFSDLYCAKMTVLPNYEVIWICIDNPGAEVDFGKLVHY